MRFVEQQVTIQMAQRRSFRPTERPSTALANSCWMKSRTSSRRALSKVRLALFQERGELADVCRIGGDSKRGQAFLDFQVVEETRDYAGIRFGGHAF